MTVPSHLRWSRPSRAVSMAVSAVLVAIWGTLRLVVFSAVILPLAYVLPLLVCVWTRDMLALFGMAGIFGVFHTLKVFWILPEGSLRPDELWAAYTATLINITVGTAAVYGIIVLRERLEDSHAAISRQAEELRAQGEELASQNEQLTEQTEELTRQTEELAAQAEELASQNQELQAQSEEIGALNEELSRREGLLRTLLESTRRADSESDTLQHIAAAALDLVGEGPGRVPMAAARKRVLVVDDNVDSAEMMSTLLEMHGHDVRMAHEGETALAAAREFEPEVGLLDIGLPGLDGYELASRLRQDAGPRRLHLIAVTGWGHDEDRQRARLAGFDAHLTKPAAPERILEFVARAGDDIGVA
jgi:CheY-like chemotaxis protein